jgi:hypothetical protein
MPLFEVFKIDPELNLLSAFNAFMADVRMCSPVGQRPETLLLILTAGGFAGVIPSSTC